MTTIPEHRFNPYGQTLHNRLTAISFALAVLLAPAAQAAGIVGTGTAASCNDATLTAALAGGGVVTFNCGAAPVTITILSSKFISASTSIDGGKLVTLSGGGTQHILYVSAAVYLGLLNLSITNARNGFNAGQAISTAATSTLQMTNVNLSANGAAGGGGSALSTEGTTVIENSTFSSNFESAIGVGEGTLSVINSTFVDNHNDVYDGAAIRVISGTLIVSGSTFSNNSVATGSFGGGAIYTGGSATITNSTFTGNSHPTHEGGAIFSMNDGSVTLRNVTISGNTAGAAGGIAANNAGAHNSIIANNTPSNCDGTTFNNTSSYNLSSDESCNFSGTGNLVNANPLLGALASNGGPTRTMALTAGSPAIDAGSPNPAGVDACAAFDQRNAARPQGLRCDIGAFEVGGGACTLDVDGNHSIDPLTDGLIIVRAMFGMTGTSVTNAAIGNGATRTTWAQIQPYLNGNCGTSFAQ
jgi:predicted outer membrane repeat protein